MQSFKNILVVTDLSMPGVHAAWRAAHIARAHGARLHLLKRLDGLDRRPSSRFGPNSPLARARADLAYLARQIGQVLDVEVTHAVHADDAPGAVARAAREAALVVVPAARMRRWGSLWRGSLAERLVREGTAPVLVTRRPSGERYQRALAAVDLRRGAARVIEMAASLCPAGSVEALHVLPPAASPALRVSASSGAALDGGRHAAGEKARQMMQALAHHASVRDAVTVVRHGPSARQVLERQVQTHCALLVVGKARRAWWEDRLFVSLARHVSQRVECDVLWVPVHSRDGGADIARSRLGTLLRPASS